jgi:hypothetical protein
MASIAQLLETRLPLNRKEVYFSATVLPGIICADDFAHFDRFLKLVGVPDSTIQAAQPFTESIQCFTEYSLAEAIYGEPLKERFPNAPGSRERPDLMILIEGSEPLLIAIEAKMYDDISKAELIQQMDRQRRYVLDYLQRCWPKLRTIHAALLPKAMKDEFGGQEVLREPEEGLPSCGIVTWEHIRDAYDGIEGVSYFREILRIAIEEYPDKKATSSWGANAEARLLGSEVLYQYEQDDPKFKMITMGRKGGIEGSELREDIVTGKWANQLYEVRSVSDNNRNWFPISEFVSRVLAPRTE